MKKNNKAYHLQQAIGPRVSNSPGRIVKNQAKSLKEKHSQRNHPLSNQSRKQDFEQINKKVEQKLQRNQQSQKTQKSYQEDFEYVNYLGDRHEESVKRSEGPRRQDTGTNPYEQIYHNDNKYFEQYLNSTAKYEFNGINLNWPYFFTKNKSQTN